MAVKQPSLFALPSDRLDGPVRLALAGGQVPFLQGPAGIGKTAGCRRIAEGLAFRDITLSDRDLPDLRLPYVERGVMQFAFDEDWPLKKYAHLHPKEGILLVDEITGCDAIMQRPIWRLALERKLGGEELLPGWRLILAGNGILDKADAYNFSFPLANRLVHFAVQPPTVEGWCAWAIGKGLSGFVIGWIRHSPTSLYKVDFDRFDAGMWAQPTPRSWEMAARIIEGAKKITAPDLDIAIAGAVGPEVATNALAWMRTSDDIPDLDDVLSGATLKVPELNGAKMILCTGLAGRVTPETMPQLARYARKLGKEFRAILAGDIKRRGSDLILAEGFGDLF
jgi:hypothetical protein